MLFFTDFTSPNSILPTALLAILLASIACGMVGSYVVARRGSYMVGAISHSLLGGIGCACFCQYKWPNSPLTPMLGAIAAAIVAAVIITFLSREQNSRQDAALSAVWTLGTAIGLSFMQPIPGYATDLNSFLFGSILLVTPTEIKTMLVLDVVLGATVFLMHSRFLSYCFHEEGLRLRGVNVKRVALVLHILISVTVVMLAQIAGLILCLALLILPVATASRFSRHLPRIMLLSTIICFATATLGLIASYELNVPTGTLIVEIAGGLYLLSCLSRLFTRR